MLSTPTFRNKAKIQPLTYKKVREDSSSKAEIQVVKSRPDKIIYFISTKTEFLFYGSSTETRQVMIWKNKYATYKRLGKVKLFLCLTN
jgi:hypothetical protein